MILYVDMEHESGWSASWGQELMAGRIKVKYRIEEITGQPCLIAHYSKVTPEFVAQFNFEAILLSGSGTDPEHYTDLDGVNAVVRQALNPIFGFCGGWQFMAQALGAAITPMGPLPPGSNPIDDPVVFREGMIQEYGFLPVQITTAHPILEGLGNQPVFWHAHYMEINPIPAGFRSYACTPKCGMQFMAHESLPLFGTQFHPEHYDEDHLDGKRLLENFFQLTSVINTTKA